MYSVWTRANALLFTALSALAIMSALTALTTYRHVAAPVVRKLELNKVHSLRHYRDNADRATLSFDLDADLSSVFNWNVKQIFVYVVAEFTTPKNANNQVVIWDRIVRTKKDARKLQFQDEGVEYFLAAQYDELRGTNITLRLEWDIMPVCGRLFVHDQGRSSFVLPDKYINTQPRLNH